MILGALMSGKTPEEVAEMLNLPLEEIKKVQEQQMTANRYTPAIPDNEHIFGNNN